jgi:hypothetical protein
MIEPGARAAEFAADDPGSAASQPPTPLRDYEIVEFLRSPAD